jgi:hypothetical protein
MITIDDIQDAMDEVKIDPEGKGGELYQEVVSSLEWHLSELRANLSKIKAYQEAFERGDYR